MESLEHKEKFTNMLIFGKDTLLDVWENSRKQISFTCSRILTNFAAVFHQAMKAQITCFISLIKLLFRLTKEKDDIQSAYIPY